MEQSLSLYVYHKPKIITVKSVLLACTFIIVLFRFWIMIYIVIVRNDLAHMIYTTHLLHIVKTFLNTCAIKLYFVPFDGYNNYNDSNSTSHYSEWEYQPITDRFEQAFWATLVHLIGLIALRNQNQIAQMKSRQCFQRKILFLRPLTSALAVLWLSKSPTLSDYIKLRRTL